MTTSTQTFTYSDYYQELIQGNERDLIGFTGFTAEDIERLHSIQSFVNQHVESLVDRFYEPIVKDPHLRSIIDNHSSVDRLKRMFSSYLLDMFSGKIGAEYLKHRHVVGAIHYRIGLSEQWYIAAYTRIQNEMLSLVINELPKKDALSILQSFQRLCSLDMQIAIGTYIGTYADSLTQYNEARLSQNEQLTKAAKDLAEHSSDMKAHVSNQRSDTERVTTGLQSLYQDSQHMQNNMLEAQSDISESMTNLEAMVSDVERSRDKLSLLNESSMNIGKVTQTIWEIAKKTKVLSLNASIEASRAGEYGRGFAVVANEVGTLAANTQHALESIRSQIEETQNHVSEFHESIEALSNKANHMNDVTNTIKKRLADSTEAAGENFAAIEGFTTTVEQFQSSFHELMASFDKLGSFSEELTDLRLEVHEQ
ncbi:globin-coupled sensor protein [Geomicrobium sp. JCM 19037]|uniref:globin-coupled sensor protein n=1 Tax=Geomicrobium sp. JCM 19037 TaxID=1460634 RepID=UPI0005A97451|nr:globin-coupled sensor protein [Geomicrobium sp. JCM 19037]